MTRQYGIPDANIIDKNLLVSAIKERWPPGIVSMLAEQDGVSFENLRHLYLNYRNLNKIDNLFHFSNLVELRLDNNVIEKIEGLDSLQNLKWLDLSFNNIEKIDGLDGLVNLETLSLYHNLISKLENMDMLKNLNVLSIGHNQLADDDNLVYLRRFLNLESLCIKQNPLCESPDFCLKIVAFLPNLTYLDYKRIDPTLKQVAHDKYQMVVDRMMAEDDQRIQNEKECEKRELQREMHAKAFVADLEPEVIIDRMYKSDPEGRLLLEVSEFKPLMDLFADFFKSICEVIINDGVETLKQRETKGKQFWDRVRDTLQTSNRDSSTKVTEYKKYFEVIIEKFNADPDSEEIQENLKECNKKVKKLHYELMHNEIKLIEKLDEEREEFRLQMDDLINKFLEKVLEHLTECRQRQTQLDERMAEVALSALELPKQGETATEGHEAMFEDRDTLNNTIQASRDAHLLLIDDIADTINKRARDWLKELEAELEDELGHSRNRTRTMEIKHITDHFLQQIEKLSV